MKKIKLCPKCRQPKLKSAVNVSGWLAPDMYECTNCKYIGYLFLEVDADEYEKMKDLEFKDNEKE